MKLPLLDYSLNLKIVGGKSTVFDPVRKLWVVLTPEEHVRQLLICYFRDEMKYPTSLMAAEKALVVGQKKLRFDLVVYDRKTHQPWLLAECKAPDVAISEATLQQLLRYHHKLQCRYWFLTNGHQHYCANAANGRIIWLDALPAYDL